MRREACEAYIKSQAHEGWRFMCNKFDDGGLSGASLERPALQALLDKDDAVNADRKGRTAIDWGVYGVPETYVVTGDGKIAYRFVGPLSEESYRTAILPEIEKAQR